MPKNTEILKSPVNKFFEEVLWMSDAEFRQWCIDLRHEVVRIWDELGMPPRIGFDDQEIEDQFKSLQGFSCEAKFLKWDEFAKPRDANKEKIYDVIRNTSVLGNAVNDWFPTMMKTRINYTKNGDDGKSIYDYFARDDLLESFCTYASRHFKRDSFYVYSPPAEAFKDNNKTQPLAETGEQWIIEFERNFRARGTHDYWLCVKELNELGQPILTNYNEKIKQQNFLSLSKDQVAKLPIPDLCKINLKNWEKASTCQIRVFEKNKEKLFPSGLKAFRVSFCQYATNFPPLTAKYIWDRYTEDFKDDVPIIVWDPSAGWGGRLVGAMAIPATKKLLYLANDPNTDHTTPDGRTKYHAVHQFFKDRVFGQSLNRFIPSRQNYTDFKFWQLGSEVMQFDPEFQQYKGKITVIFTSPPYFAKEAYSEDPEQSYKKFSKYDLWRDGFLHETLKTAVEWLRPGGYIAWNIADAVFDGDMLPLEKDSIDFLTSHGMKHIQTLKMTLAQMPGGNRLGEDGLPKAKNFCKVNNIWLKYEPIFIFQKPR
jgi:hypothetical protein